MPSSMSKNVFRKGLRAVADGRHLEALAYIEAAMQIEGHRGAPLPMSYLSYFGLCLCLGSSRHREARELCERAARAEFYNPDLHLNLGQVCARAGDRRSAFEAYVRGLRLNPHHPGLVRALRRLGIRRRPVIGFLSRRNPVNRVLGRLRAGAAGAA
ncbi:MAG: hypothetical protein ACE5JH_06840 [Acidobacteriota bacterium]